MPIDPNKLRMTNNERMRHYNRASHHADTVASTRKSGNGPSSQRQRKARERNWWFFKFHGAIRTVLMLIPRKDREPFVRLFNDYLSRTGGKKRLEPTEWYGENAFYGNPFDHPSYHRRKP